MSPSYWSRSALGVPPEGRQICEVRDKTRPIISRTRCGSLLGAPLCFPCGPVVSPLWCLFRVACCWSCSFSVSLLCLPFAIPLFLLCASFASSVACSGLSWPPVCLPVPLLYLCLSSVSLLLRVPFLCLSCVGPSPWCCLTLASLLSLLCPSVGSTLSCLCFSCASLLCCFRAGPLWCPASFW